MKTRVNQNSIEALRNVKLSKRQKEVFATIHSIGCVSAKGVAYSMNVPINFVTGRINELMHKQKIKIAKVGRDKLWKAKNVNYYSVRTPGDPLNIFGISWEERYNGLADLVRVKAPDLLYEFEVLTLHEL